MKKIKELSKRQQIIVLILLFIIFISTTFYLKEIINPDNYETKIDCGNGTIITYEGKKEVNIYIECPNLLERLKNG